MIIDNCRKIVHSNIGAQILSSKFSNGLNLFYKSPLYDFGKTCRGGVPVLFPQFANCGHLQKHGFVRDMEWDLMYEFQDEKQSIIEYDCNIYADDYPEWPYNAKLSLFCEMANNVIAIKLLIINTDSKSFEFTGGLHPYFTISSRDQIAFEGLKSATFRDSYPDIPFDFNGNALIERLYEGNKPIHFFNGESWLTIKSKGFNSWMIWNPGKTGGAIINDLPDDHWDKFICIEPVFTIPKILAPGELFIGELHIASSIS